MTRLITDGLISDHRFNTGDFIDYTNNGHDGTPNAAAKLEKMDGVTQLTTNQVVVPDHNDYHGSQITIFTYGNIFRDDGRVWGTPYPFLKDAEFGITYQAILGNALFATNGTTSTLAGVFAGKVVKSYAVTVKNGSKAKFYLNGVYEGEGATVGSWTVGSGDVLFNNSASYNGVGGALYYDRILTDDEVAQLNDWADEQISISKMKEQRRFDSPITGDEDGLVLAITGKQYNGKVYDLSPNGHDGVCENTATGKPMNGQDSLYLDNIRSYVSFGDDDAFSFGDGSNDSPFSVAVWVNPNILGTAEGIIGKDDQTFREWAISLVNGRIRIFIKNAGGGNQQSIDSTTILKLDTPVRIAVTYDGRGGNNGADGLSIYINGIKETPYNVIKNAYTAMVNTTAPLDIGRYYLTNRMGGELNDVMLFNKELSQAEVTADYEGYKHTVFFDDCSDYNVSAAARDSAALENSNWNRQSGTWKISKDTIFGESQRVIECVTDGILWQDSEMTVGTWEWDVYKELDTNLAIIGFMVSAPISNIEPNQKGYVYYLSSTNQVALYDTITNLALFRSSTSYVASKTWYKMRITRNVEGTFTAYIKGGAFTNWTKVVAASGTNPVTDINYIDAKILLVELDAGDKIANFKFINQVVDPT